MIGPRYRKLTEFAAHSGDVRCARFGRKTGGLLVTGGDDHLVNVWILGKNTATFSLTGHVSPVESVCFDNDEWVVAAGGANGSIKLFELQAGKVTKNFPGHKSNVTSLSWHPYGATVVSGSMDTVVKVWDLKSAKDAVVTIKGHRNAVSHVRFSPDGNWIASASFDGSVKVWDIRTQKCLVEVLPPSRHEITALEFSPTEYLLATCSKDRTLRLWDMDGEFHSIYQSPPETGPVRSLAFTKDGKYLLGALQDACRSWSVEPPEQADFVSVPWTRIHDLAIRQSRGHRLLGCSFNSTMVGVYEVPLQGMRPFSEDPDYTAPEQGASVDGNPAAASSNNFLGVASAAQGLPPEAALRRLSVNDRSSATGGGNAAPYNGAAAFAGNGSRPSSGGPAEQLPSVGVGRSVERSGSAASAGHQAPYGHAAPYGAAAPGSHGGGARPPYGNNRYSEASPSPASSQDFEGAHSRAEQRVPSRGASGPPSSSRPPMVSIGVGVGESLMRGQLQPEDLQRPPGGSRQQVQPRQRPAAQLEEPAYNRPVQQLRPEAMSDPHGPPMPGPSADQRYPWLGPLGQGASDAGPSGADRRGGGGGGYGAGGGDGGYSASGAGYGASGGGGGAVHHGSDAPSDMTALLSVGRQHPTFLATMKKRGHTLTLLRSFAAKGDWRGAISCARRSDDPALFADLLDVMYERRDAFTMDMVSEVVPLLEAVLALQSDRHVQVGLNVVTLLLRSFGQVIRDLCAPSARGAFIDISFEERRDRAEKARAALLSLAPKLKTLSRQSGVAMTQAQDVLGQLTQLEAATTR